ncbi:hypothetical protein [Klebsiella variicola]|uniref:hypothetical protein n=1 Tax=Klebsiella variicola TaxID=244366 RepID=UPI0013C33E68|nr:hypothetical protein [Klebsiella variicola]
MADLDFSGVGTALDSLMSKLTDSIISKAAGFTKNYLLRLLHSLQRQRWCISFIKPFR